MHFNMDHHEKSSLRSVVSLCEHCEVLNHGGHCKISFRPRYGYPRLLISYQQQICQLSISQMPEIP